MMGLCLTASTKPTGNEPYRTLSGYAVGFFRVRLDPRPPLPYDGRMLTWHNNLIGYEPLYTLGKHCIGVLFARTETTLGHP